MPGSPLPATVLPANGLWPDDNPRASNNGPGWEIRTGMERTAKAKVSRYYLLTADQTKALEALLLRNVTWGYTHNCSSWAHEIIWKVVHEDVDADDYLWFSETPRELGRNIQQLEAKNPTSRNAHKNTNAGPGGASSSAGAR